MRQTPRWNEELPLNPRPPMPAPRRYEITIDKRRPIGVVITNVRGPGGPALRGPITKHTTISSAEAAAQRRRHLGKLRARIYSLDPAVRAGLLQRLAVKARLKGVL